MNIFKKTKDGLKTRIEICGIKFSYISKHDLRREIHKLKQNLHIYRDLQHEIYNIKQNLHLEIKNNSSNLAFAFSKIKILRNMFIDASGDIEQKKYIIAQKFLEHGNSYFPDIDNPKTLNEKIQWIKLYYQDPKMTECSDKVLFKEYLTRIIGDEYVVPTYGIFNNADEIDFDTLPEEFVLKSNWGGDSSQVIIHTKKSTITKERIRYLSNKWLTIDNNIYYDSFIWCYKNIKPKLIVEKLLKPTKGPLLDYKFLCFNGEPRVAFVPYDRQNNLRRDFFDMEWNKLDFIQGCPNSDFPTSPPANFEKMKEICRALASPFPFVRIDFYEVDGKLYIGEFTFTSLGGFRPFTPVEWDYKLGSWLELPDKLITDK